MGLVLFILTFLGLRMVWRGWRGVRAGTELRCIRCDFDLTGRRQGDRLCPECGEKVLRVGGMVQGHRVRSPRRIKIGLVVAFLSSLPLVLIASGAKINWTAMEPGWMLRWEFEYGPVSRQYAAGSELLARAKSRGGAEALRRLADRFMAGADREGAGTLVAEELALQLSVGGPPQAVQDAIVSWALNRQKDRTRPFPTGMGDIIEHAYWAKQLDDARYAAYLDNICSPELRLGAPVPAYPGQSVPAYIDWHWRGGSGPFSFKLDVPGLRFGRAGYDAWFGGPAPLFAPHEEITVLAPEASIPLDGTLTISIGTQYLTSGLASSYPTLAGATRAVSEVTDHNAEFRLHATLTVQPPGSDRDMLKSEIGASFQAAGCAGYGPRLAAVPLFITLPPSATKLDFAIDWDSDGEPKRVSEGTVSADDNSISVSTAHSGMTSHSPVGSKRPWVQHSVWVPTRSARITKGMLRIHVLRAWNGTKQVLSQEDGLEIDLPVEMSR